MSDSLQPHELQHARLLCPSLSPRVCSYLCPMCWWCHPTVSPLLLLLSIFPSIRVFSNELALQIRWPKYRSFSISPFNEYSGDWFPLGLTGWSPGSPRDSQESSLAPQFRGISCSVLSLLYGPALTFIHSFHYRTLCQQSDSVLFNMLLGLF